MHRSPTESVGATRAVEAGAGVGVGSAHARGRSGRVVKAMAIGLISAFLVGAAIGALSATADAAGHGVTGTTVRMAWDGWTSIVLNPFYWAFLGALILAQWKWPARRELPGLSVGLAQDLIWFLTSTVLTVTVVSGYLAVLDAAYTHVVTRSLHLGTEVGSWGLPLLALLVTDLIAWCSHYLHHRLPVLWAFHSVHHSQEQMNVLSDSRQHLVETLITSTMVFLPARLLGLDAPAASALTFLSIYVGAFIHANIRTNLGPAGYLLMSPQAHRVHHSSDPDHYDTNFGVILGFWDHLFGTEHRDRDVYPPTGIGDRTFPLERRSNPAALIGTWFRQMAYPFRVLISGPQDPGATAEHSRWSDPATRSRSIHHVQGEQPCPASE